MIYDYNTDGFPFECLPEDMKNVIYETAANVQVAYSMVAGSLIGVMSLAIQRYADVKRPNGLVSPSSIYTLSIAESGDRKSTVDKLLTKSILEFETVQQESYSSEVEKYKADKAFWDVKHKEILRVIKKDALRGDNENNLSEMLRQHLSNEPKHPNLNKLLLRDVTPEAIIKSMSEKRASLGLFSDEAVNVLNGRAMNDIGLINKLWDGSNIVKSRVGSGETHIQDPRLTCSLMTQRKVFSDFVDKNGEEVRKVGLLARFLITAPPSYNGCRETITQEPEWKHLAKFNGTVGYFLGKSIESESNKVIEFNQFAKQRWLEACDFVEYCQSFMGDYFELKDFASRFGENVARLAVLIQLFSDRDSNEINENIMIASIEVCKWYLKQAKTLLVKPPKYLQLENEDREDYISLYNWFASRVNSPNNYVIPPSFTSQICINNFNYQFTNQRPFKRNEVYQLAPNRIRKDKARFNRALDCLFRLRVAQPYTISNGKKHTHMIIFFPNVPFNGIV